MGGYTDLKRRKMLKLLSWLSTQESFVVSTGGRHQWVVKHEKWQRPFAVPFKHNTINKFKLIPKKERPKWNGIYKPQYTDYVDIQEKAQKYKLSVYGLLNGKLYSLTYKNNKFFLDKEKKPKDVIA